MTHGVFRPCPYPFHSRGPTAALISIFLSVTNQTHGRQNPAILVMIDNPEAAGIEIFDHAGYQVLVTNISSLSSLASVHILGLNLIQGTE